jgi:hypothetical protein
LNRSFPSILNTKKGWQIKNPFFICLLVSLCTLLAHGLLSHYYIVYNVLSYHYGAHQEIYNLKSLGGLSPIPMGLIGVFTKLFSYVLQAPIPFVFASILIKAVLMFVVYKIFSRWLQEGLTTLLISLIFCLSVEGWTHGMAHIGLWGDPFFFRGSVSSLFLFFGMIFFLKNQWVWGALLAGTAIHFHPLNSVAALTFFMPSLIYDSFKQEKPILKKSTIAIMILLTNALYFLLGMKKSSAPAISSTIQEWHNFVVKVNWDDMSLIYTFGMYGVGLVPLLTATILIIRNRTIRKEIDSYFIVALALLGIFLGIEVMHFLEIQWGKLSEYFISIQFRRGLWVLMLFSFVIVVDFLIENSKNIFAEKKFIFLSVLFLNCFLYPSILACFIFHLILVVLWRNKYSGILMISLLIMLGANYFIENSSATSILRGSLKSISYVTFSTTVLFTLFLCFPKRRQAQEVIKYSVAAFLIVGVLAGIYRSKFLNEYNLISTDGAFNYPNHRKILLSDMRRSGKRIDVGFIDKIRELNKDRELILLTSEKNIVDPSLLGMPTFWGPYDLAMASLSKGYYEHMKFKAVLLMGYELESSDLISKFENKKFDYDKYLENISIERLKGFRKNGIRYIVWNKPSISFRKHLKPIYINDSFEVYDLNRLVGFK